MTQPKYDDYLVCFTEVEWDADPRRFEPQLIQRLPKEGKVRVSAPSENCAKDWAMSDFSDNNGFCITSCHVAIKRIVLS